MNQTRKISLVIIALVFIAAFLSQSHKVAAVNRTWDGGGTTNNWSEAANWSGDTVPGPFDIAIFDGTSSKSATIDTNIDVSGIQVNTGYTGTITQAAGVNINIGNFGSYAQADGTFNGGNGNFTIAFHFMLSGGTFNAPTGTLAVGDNFTHTSGGTFNHNSGTVSFTGTGGTIDVATSETFNNLSWNLINGFSLSIPAGDTLIVTGNLALNDGAMQGGGTVEVRAGVTIGPNFDGVIAGAVTLLITPGDGNPRTLTFDVGDKVPSLNLNAANVTVTTAGVGTIDFQFQTLTLQAGTIQQGSVGLTVKAYTQSGGTFTGGSGLFTVFDPGGGGPFTQSAGTFTGGSGDIGVQGTFTLSGGTFTSTTGILAVGSFTHSSGTFNHNSGTVAFTGTNPTINVATASETFNHVAFNMTTDFSFTIPTGKTLIATGNLAFNTGKLGGDGTIEARANVTVGPSFGGAAAGTPTLLFSGSADQTFTNNGGANPGGIWTANKSGGGLTLLSDLILQTTQPLNVTAGVFNQGASFNVTVGSLTVGADGIYRNFGTGDLTLGGNVSNTGVIEMDGGGQACGDADSILIRSSASGTQRLWSGSGTFRLQDVNVQDQAGSAAITVFNSTDAGNNGANWTFSTGCAPTEVTLVSFTANGYADGRVQLQWQTGYESDNLGFRLYRDEAGKRTLVNSQLVAGSALTSQTTLLAGQSYTYMDNLPAANASYWLEDIDLDGTSTWHGPFFVTFKEGAPQPRPRATLLSELGRPQPDVTRPVETRALTARPSAEQAALQSALAAHAAAKIAVRREGWYRIPQSQFAAAGFDTRTDPRRLQLFADGREVPILVPGEADGSFDTTDAIEFYGVSLDSPYTDAHVYWLVAGNQPGRRIEQIKAEAAPSSTSSFTATVERRDRSVYFSSLRNGERENFFGAVISSNPVDQTLSVAQLAAGDAVLEIALQGVTFTAHRVTVEVNGVTVGEVVFEGQSPAVARFNLPVALRDGPNTVRLAAIGPSRDVSLVDAIRITYPRRYTADGDALKLTAPANQAVTISGFTAPDIRVVDVTNMTAPQEVIGTIKREAGGYSINVATPGDGERTLIAFTSAQSPATVALNQPANLRKGKANYLIIAPREFADSLRPLVALRRQQGLSVALVDIEDIYDEFSFGERSPYAVRDFLSFARSNWKKKPRYVLFAADASFDPKNYLGLGETDLVPTRLIDTDYMETASDDWFSDFNGDGIADMVTGRLPARSSDELSLLVSKIVAYESAGLSEEALLVADADDDFDFEGANQKLLPLIKPDLRVTQVNRGRLADTEARRLLLDDIHRKQMVVNYAGHGSVNLWRGQLLTNDDASALRNEHLPLFVMMTCLNGYFTDPALDSLGEALLKSRRGGAIAVWASSGMTLPAEQALMNQELYRLLWNQAPALRLGEAVRRAKAAVNNTDIRRTWILFGDPAMRLK